jgi:hypothetical protein
MLLCWDVESIQDTRNDDYRASNAWGPSREKVSSFISWQLLKRLHFVVYSTFYGSFELQKVQTEIYASYLYMNTPNVGLNGPVVYVLIYVELVTRTAEVDLDNGRVACVSDVSSREGVVSLL